MFDGKCAYCGCEITVKSMHVDHVDAIFRESHWDRKKRRYVQTGEVLRRLNDNPENLFPACAPCNLWKHAMSVEDFRESMQTQIDKIRKTSCGFRLLERFGIVTINDPPGKFFFETFQETEQDGARRTAF